MVRSGKRDDIIRVALELFAKQGFHRTPMAMIAEKARVGAGTIYRYFENKDLLVNELFGDVERKFMATIQDGYDPDKPMRERFIHISTSLLMYSISHPLYFRYIEQYQNSPYGVSFRRDKLLGKSDDHDLLKELFDQGIAQQVLKDLPLPVLFALAFGPLIAIARDHILGFFILDDALILKTVEACWDGIKR
jgi:AcrR family transcriptional regulator